MRAAVLADYHIVRDVLGPDDFAAFCAGYLCFGDWKAARERSRDMDVIDVLRGDVPGRASYAA